jgi:hypothetical protein
MSQMENTLLGSAKELPESDVDYGYVSSVASKTVEDAVKEEDSTSPKPASKTSAFYAMIGTSIAGIVALVLVNKGFIGASQSGMATELMSGAITLGIAWIVGKFIEARGKVSVAKVQLQQQQLALKLVEEHETKNY